MKEGDTLFIQSQLHFLLNYLKVVVSMKEVVFKNLYYLFEERPYLELLTLKELINFQILQL